MLKKYFNTICDLNQKLFKKLLASLAGNNASFAQIINE